MKYKIRLSLSSKEGNEIATEDIFEFQKGNERIKQIGLSLKKSKAILGAIQEKLVRSQINQIILEVSVL